VYELYDQVGYAAIIGLIVMIVFFPIAGIMTKKQIGYQRNAATKTDHRVTTVNEFIQGIRVCKYYVS
jgi:ATP-binding cassette subfamily C (CFTR/MRP) protein 4